jgi:type VI secretion system ImpC/EvpB family protein
MPERLKFDVGFGRPGRRREGGDPMRLLVLGDFRGDAGAERPPLASRPTQQVDVDTLDAALRRLRPSLTVPTGEIVFDQIDDFHPDRLYARLDVFKALRERRAAPPGGDEDIGRLLGKGPQPKVPPPAAAGGLDAFIREAIAPHIVKDTSAQTQAYVAAVDSAIAEQMRTLLHDAAFQSLEAAWRGVYWLVSRLELDENLQLYLFDVSRTELLTDLADAKGQIANTGLYRALVDRWRDVPGAQGWSALITLARFGPSNADIGLLAALGLVASQAGGPVLGDGDEVLAGDNDAALEGWRALRHSEAAPWIALAAPRILLRAPYGSRSDPIESFRFEEFVGPPVHDEFLWGYSSLGLAMLIGRGFTDRGWDMQLGEEREIDDLPAYTFTRDGEREMQACGERFLTEGEMRRLASAGLVPIASRRDRNAVVAVQFQSIAEPSAPLVW